MYTYHDGERRGVHDDGENSGGEATEELPCVAMQSEERDQSHDGENGQHEAEQTNCFGPLSLHGVHDEHQHVHRLYHRTCAVDRRYQYVVR